MKGMIDMRKKMKIGPRVAIITSAMILAGTMAACGSTTGNTDNKTVSATVSDASMMDEDKEDQRDVADNKDSKENSSEEKTTSEKSTTEKQDGKLTTEKENSGKSDSKTDTTEKPGNSKPSATESKPATTQASNTKPSTTESKPATTQASNTKPSTTESKPGTTQAPSNTKPSTTESKPATTQHQTTQATTEAAREHSWVYSWKEKKENVKIADEYSYPEMAAALRCRDCGQASLASQWNNGTCPLCGRGGNYTTTSDMPTGNMITEPAIYQEKVVGYTCTIKCSRCGETRTFECDENMNGSINVSGKCK